MKDASATRLVRGAESSVHGASFSRHARVVIAEHDRDRSNGCALRCEIAFARSAGRRPTTASPRPSSTRVRLLGRPHPPRHGRCVPASVVGLIPTATLTSRRRRHGCGTEGCRSRPRVQSRARHTVVTFATTAVGRPVAPGVRGRRTIVPSVCVAASSLVTDPASMLLGALGVPSEPVPLVPAYSPL